MELQLVGFNQALLLKEFGFPQENEYEWELGYNKNGRVCPYGIEGYGGTIECYAPTLELVAKWLRDEKGLYYIESYIQGIFIPGLISKEGTGFPIIEGKYTTHEEALSAGIDKAIEILKRNKYNN